MSCLNRRPIEVVLSGWSYESAEGTIVVGRSCGDAVLGVLLSEPGSQAVELSGWLWVLVLLSLSVLCDAVSFGCSAE